MLTKTPGIVIAKTITIEQIKAPIRKNKKFLPTLIGLGLNKLHRVRTLEDTPSVRGMIRKVMHMVVIVEGDPFPEPAGLLKSFANDSDSRDTEISRRQPYSRKGVVTKSEDGLDVEKFFEQADSNAIAAAELGSALLSAAKGADALTGLTSIQTRGQFAAMARKLYLMIFSSDRVAAATAAYALISNSRSYGKGLDPRTKIDQLPKREAAAFYEGVRAMLKKHDVNFVTSLSADKVSVSGNDATVKVHLTISKKLAFDIDGKKVIVGDGEPARFGKDDLVIRCSLAKEPPILTVHPGDGIDIVVEATAEFVMDNDKTTVDLPIDIIAPDYEEYRKIPFGTKEHT